MSAPDHSLGAGRKPLSFALLLSLLIHALLLSLTFAGQGWGLPGLALPWQQRRAEAPKLQVVLMPGARDPPAAHMLVTPDEPVQPASISPQPELATEPQPTTALKPEAAVTPPPEAATEAVPAEAASPAEVSVDAAPAPTPEPPVLAVERPSEWVVAPNAASAPTPVPAIAAAPSASSPEAARIETERKEAARREAERVEAQRLETERQALQRLETTRLEVARQQLARQDAAKLAAQQTENARLEAERQQVTRQEVARQEAARAEAAQDEARREASRRAMGRQLDEEAARREAASVAANLAPRLDPSSSGARRGRLFGRTDPNAELILYAEAWARKIELNMTVDRIRDAAKRPHSRPLVTVAIRHDGSVESVTFVLSSGVPEIDDAIRRIVDSLLPYPAFPPALAREYDVIEIRRSWVIDTAVRLY